MLVDELAHTSPDGTRHRWEDVAAWLNARMAIIAQRRAESRER